MRPLWLALGVLTCVLAGTTLNKCLCGAEEPPVASLNVVSDPIMAPAATAGPGAPVGGNDGVGTVQNDQPRESKKLPKLKDIAKEKGLVEKKKDDKTYIELTFDFLASWVYEFPEDPAAVPQRPDPIPEKIRKLTGKDVAIRGFMIPYKVDGEDVIEFLLVRNQFACCFGVVPKMNEWLHIKMAPGKKAPYAVDIPITVYGEFEAKELIEKGVVMSLYRMEATEVEEPPVFR